MAKTKKTTAAAAELPCECSLYDVLLESLTETGEYDSYTTGCNSTRHPDRTFAAGHDAKLKSFLIRWGTVADADIRRHQGGVASSADAVKHASRYGFTDMVREGIEKRLAKNAAKADKKLAKLTAKSARAESAAELAEAKAEFAATLAEVQAEKLAPAATEDAPMLGELVQAKVGRWTYTGYVQDGEFIYTDKKGKELRTAKYQIVK